MKKMGERMDESFSDLIMDCNNCRLKFYATELKLEPGTNTLMCVNCLSFPNSRIKILKDKPVERKVSMPALASASSLPKIVPRKEDRMTEVAAGYTSYKCNTCSYSFQRKSNWQGNCPYCAKSSIKVLQKG